MAVKVTREAEPQIELYGAYSGQLSGNGRTSLTFTATDTYLIMVPKNAVSRPQLELGSFATSYIPTAASTVTRNADVVTMGLSQFPYSSAEGSVIANATTFSGLPYCGVVYFTGSAILQQCYIDKPSNYVNCMYGGVTIAVNVSGTKFATAWSSNGTVVISGTNTDTNGTGFTSYASALSIGLSTYPRYLNGHIKQITIIPRRLTNSELQTRTI